MAISHQEFNRGMAILIVCSVTMLAPFCRAAEAVQSVRTFGATSNAKSKDIEALHAARDVAAKTGGTVRIPPYQYGRQ